MKRILLLMLVILFVSCAPMITQTSEVLPSPVSPTVEKMATFTATPTSTPVSTTTPERTAIVEIDLKPNYAQEVSREFMGVKINASLITDKSLDPVITKVTVGDEAYAEFIARSIYKVWLSKGDINGNGPVVDTNFEQFMELWAVAQKSGKEEDWRKVQVKNISANDLATDGYNQNYYDVWFMHDGKVPKDITSINKISIVLMKSGASENITMANESTSGKGTNIFANTLYYYRMPAQGSYRPGDIAAGIASFPKWLIINTPKTMIAKVYNLDSLLTNLLLNTGNLQVH